MGFRTGVANRRPIIGKCGDRPRALEWDIRREDGMNRTRFLSVGDGHEIHYEHHGDRDRPCFLYLHGGPGGGIRDDERDLLLGAAGQAVLFDQRGAGRSRCADALAGNTTADLIADIERLRAAVGVDRWTLFGGSWGSTLALAYAIAHPQRVRAMILWGIFLCRRRELDWFSTRAAPTASTPTNTSASGPPPTPRPANPCSTPTDGG
jgi:proline iminopeptidase